MSDRAIERLRPERGKLSVLLAVTLSSVTLFRFVELPTLNWGALQIFGSPLGFSLDGGVLLTLLVVGLVATGTLAILQDHPQREAGERPLLIALITPSMGALVVSIFLIQAATWPLWLAVLLVGGAIIGMLVHLSYQAISPRNPAYPGARTLLNVVGYLMGFVLFSLSLGQEGRGLIIAPVVMVLSGSLALELLSATGAPIGSVLLYSATIGLLEGELAWVLGYWPISTWTAATVLTLGLYIWGGVGYQHLLGRLTRQIVVEFTAIGLLMLVLVLAIRP
ncbi:MAG: hypothetical protein MUF84_02915 [Anaerolineae bacterium]|jgi:hypothetical protein|nr:hypothetical protein [Anaerolineae bacterium]